MSIIGTVCYYYVPVDHLLCIQYGSNALLSVYKGNEVDPCEVSKQQTEVQENRHFNGPRPKYDDEDYAHVMQQMGKTPQRKALLLKQDRFFRIKRKGGNSKLG